MWKMTTWKSRGVLFALLFIAICGLSAFALFSMKPPSEVKLIGRFNVHRSAYESLRAMLLEDKQIREVYVGYGLQTTGSPLLRGPSEINFPVSRYNEYETLLQQAETNAAFRSGDLICIGAWGAGWAGYTRHIWICSTDQAPNQVTSLDAYYRDAKRPHNVFKHIDGDWYLRADW
jgi:hypothetical protein